MIDVRAFGDAMQLHGYRFFSGVPCSFLKHLINYSINHCTFVMSANEGDAVACCAGAQLAGQKSVVLMQNSGLTNATSPLTSLNHTFQLPVLGFVSLRGEPGLVDEPQHQLMGQITEKMLELMDVEWAWLSQDLQEAKTQLAQANAVIESNKPFFFVVKKGTFGEEKLHDQQLASRANQLLVTRQADDSLPTREDVLTTLASIQGDNTAMLATTGKTGRELYEIADKPNNLYMVGSMGCIGSLALGVALHTSKQVIAIDGDGALLMRMGSLVTNGYYGPPNLLHILIDNHMHDSTGGQRTLAHNADFVQIAASAGYTRSIYVDSLAMLGKEINTWRSNPAHTFMYVRVRGGTKANLGRPGIQPPQIKQRFMDYLNG